MTSSSRTIRVFLSSTFRDLLPLRLHWPFGRSQKFFDILAKYWY
jgi:hypothetical protein